MGNLKAGFARVDVTPNIGYCLEGSYNKRVSEGVLDNLYATAVAFDDGENKVVIISLDAIGMSQENCDIVRKKVAEKIGTDIEAVYLCCTHSHLSLGFRIQEYLNEEEVEMKKRTFENVIHKVCDAAVMAVNDLKPASLFYSTGKAEGISYIRRYRMTDGAVCTFVQPENMDYVVGQCAETDTLVQHLIIKREDGEDIGIVNFPVHPDSIGGLKISADFPHFVRDTYEKLIENSRCMFLTGTQGDANGTNIYLPKEHPARRSYIRARRMGRTIAMAALANYELAIPLEGDKISFINKKVMLKHNKGKDEEVPFALEVEKVNSEFGSHKARDFVSERTGLPIKGENPWNEPALHEMRRLLRIARLSREEDYEEIYVSAVAVGDVVFAGFPGEPFTDVGRQVRKNSKFPLTITTCATNGYEGYFPTKDAFEENGYESSTARYACGTAEELIANSTEIVNELYNRK